MNSLGPVSHKHQDWFDENDKEIQGLLEEKHQKHKAYLSDISSVSIHAISHALRKQEAHGPQCSPELIAVS